MGGQLPHCSTSVQLCSWRWQACKAPPVRQRGDHLAQEVTWCSTPQWARWKLSFIGCMRHAHAETSTSWQSEDSMTTHLSIALSPTLSFRAVTLRALAVVENRSTAPHLMM